jgi:hypothetical protein
MNKATNRAVPFLERMSCSVDEASEATSICRAKLYALMKTGDLEFRKCGRRRVVLVPSLKRLIEGEQPTTSA